jgi:hypothetical protein
MKHHSKQFKPRQSPRVAEPAPEPDGLVGTWASVRAAAQLAGVAEVEIPKGLIGNRVRSQRRGGALVVELSDVAKLANEKGVAP